MSKKQLWLPVNSTSVSIPELSVTRPFFAELHFLFDDDVGPNIGNFRAIWYCRRTHRSEVF